MFYCYCCCCGSHDTDRSLPLLDTLNLCSVRATSPDLLRSVPAPLRPGAGPAAPPAGCRERTH
jgi:hypothetical protein